MFKSNMDGINCGTSCEPMSEQVKQSFHDKFGMILDGKIIDGIFETVQSLASSQFGNKNMLEILSHNVLQFLSNAHPCYKSNSTISPAIGCLAPQIHPLRKVMSRLSLHLPENNVPGPCQSDLISPIGRLNLSPSRGGMDAMKVPATTSMQNILPKASDGSKQAPIPVGDTTPEAILKADASPGVTITGTSSFKDKQKELAAKGDDVYNRTVHPRSSHVNKPMKIGVGSLHVVEEGVEVVDVDKFVQKQPAIVNGFVTLQPKNSLVFPLADNPRFPVSDDDIMHFCAIVELAYTDRIQKNYALKYHGVHCSFISLGQTLMRDGHIDNFLIPCFCRKLFEDNHPSKSGRHYFFSYVGESILDLSSPMQENIVRTSFLGAARASKGKRLDLSDRLFFPICHLDHWFSFVVDFKFKLFAFLDSFYSAKSDYQIAVRAPLIRNFTLLWKKIFNSDEPDFKKFSVMTPNMPRQGNAHDCGVFTMRSVEVFDPTKDLRKEFSKDDVLHLRIQYANRLFFHSGNTVDYSIVTNYYVKEDFVRQLR
ncbi:uncharacterized protein [Lolium perenne]|uniref:uncharacterized protein n=1 Tax=Lolium perenne TaxID=4522 RepID=UPI0021F641AE|nr:uncharacterized protein LOC127315422 [Lolium perenne]